MIDYGVGQANIDIETGIRYGVISQNEVLQAWCDASEAYYGEPHCPKCGDEAGLIDDAEPEIDRETYETERGCCGDLVCDRCKLLFDISVTCNEPLSHSLDDGEYKAECGDSGDIFVIKSPYFTYGPFCSPCAPGAVYLASASDYDAETGIKAYCFGKDFFDDNQAPYRYYMVATGEEVK